MTVSTYRNPCPREAASLLQEALSKRRFITILGCCRVEYEGRASSTLDWGDRLTVIKIDGSILVHRPNGYEPVNWQPAGCIFKVEDCESELRIRASRLQPREILNINFKAIYHLSASSLIDNGEFALHVTELDMKKAILACPQLVEEGLRPLASEKDLGESGFVDVFAEDTEGCLVVVEIKRVPAGKEAVLQLERYLKALRKRVNKKVRGIIVAPDLRKEAQPLLYSSKLEFRLLPLKKCYHTLKLKKTVKLIEYLS